MRPFRWVGGDSVYGDSPTFVQGVRALEKWYVLDIPSDTTVWLKKPRMRRTGRVGSRGGRPPKNPHPLTKPITVAAAIKTLPASAFRQVTVKQGRQGPIVYEYAELTVWFSEERNRIAKQSHEKRRREELRRRSRKRKKTLSLTRLCLKTRVDAVAPRRTGTLARPDRLRDGQECPSYRVFRQSLSLKKFRHHEGRS